MQASQLEDIVKQILKGQDVSYEIRGKDIVVKRNARKSVFGEKKKGIVTGIISDVSGEPVIGANVLVKGTTTGTITDINGHYSIDAPSDGHLLISYLGYEEQTISVSGKIQ